MRRITNMQLAERLDDIRASIDEWNNPITSADDLREAASRLRALPDAHIVVDEAVAFWAFRYCLSRSSYAVADGVRLMKDNWWAFPASTRAMVHKEIREHLELQGDRVHVCDRDAWCEVLSMPVEP